jgi:RimJ/RimL family protein N-acetyltransferase
MAEFRHETARLILRDWREDDWPVFWHHCNTPSVMRWLGGVADEATIVAATGRLEAYRRDHGHTFWVCERQNNGGHLSGELLGFCGLKRSNQPPGPIGMMEVGWRLREDAWGQGYAKEAAIASLDLAFDHFGADEVIAVTVPSNEASWGLMLRLGMIHRKDLDFPSKDFDPEGGVNIVYAITRAEWSARNG